MKIAGFDQEKILGEGSYGKVYKVRRSTDNQFYAMKLIDLNRLSFREIEDAVNEIRLMASITSPFILSFYEAFAAEKKKLCIITEYARIGDLRHLIERRQRKSLPFKEEQIWQFLLEILEGLRILHSCGVVHRDLKSANILISAPDLIKIGDLGIATVLHKHKTNVFSKEMAKTQIGTPLYLAPEIWMHFPYDQKCDMWSLGVLLYEMMTFDFPFIGRSQNELQARICSGRFSIPKKFEKMYSNDLISILRSLLNVEPKERPSVDDLFRLKSVQNHMQLLNPFLQKQFDLFRNSSLNEISMEGGKAKLLSTIHIPRQNYRYNYRYGRSSVNLSDLHLPTQKYNQEKPMIKPIEQRIQMKQGAQMRLQRNIPDLSSDEYMQIAEQDLWTKNREMSIRQQQEERNKLLIDLKNKFNQKQQNLSDAQQERNQILLNFKNKFDERQQQIKNLQQQQQKIHQMIENDYQIKQPIIPLKQNQEVRNPINVNVNQQKPRLLPPMQNQPNKQPFVGVKPPFAIQNPEQSPSIKIAPRIIPAHYAHLYKPCQNNQNQDPRWKKKIPSLRRQPQPNYNNNNIFFKQQQDVPWWFGQELQPSPVHVRKNPLVGFNNHFN